VFSNPLRNHEPEKVRRVCDGCGGFVCDELGVQEGIIYIVERCDSTAMRSCASVNAICGERGLRLIGDPRTCRSPKGKVYFSVVCD
jgi:hypothetical protein